MGEVPQRKIRRQQPHGRLMEAILPVGATHLDAIIEIAKESFSVVWKPKEFLYFLEHPLGVKLGLFEDNQLQGYFLGLLVRGELDIVSIATAVKHRQQGKGERLLHYVLELPQVDVAFLEVEAGNVAAQALYSKLGFEQTGVRRKYYQQTQDAHLMRWKRSRHCERP